MGISFAGAPAPKPRRPHPFAWLPRLLLAAIIASILVALAVFGLYLTTYPALVTYILQPFSLLLLPGVLLEGIGHTEFTFSKPTAIVLSFLIYFLLAAYLLRPTNRPSR